MESKMFLIPCKAVRSLRTVYLLTGGVGARMSLSVFIRFVGSSHTTPRAHCRSSAVELMTERCARTSLCLGAAVPGTLDYVYFKSTVYCTHVYKHGAFSFKAVARTVPEKRVCARRKTACLVWRLGSGAICVCQVCVELMPSLQFHPKDTGLWGGGERDCQRAGSRTHKAS